MNNQTNIHYYFSDNTKISSKVIALEYEQIKKEQCLIYYHDDIYDKINWVIEPPLTLNDYYKEQAKKIRDEYDYVILCYSGGIDSTNILETFYYNNIKLDKIISVGAFAQDRFTGDDSNHNGELYYNVFPYIEKLGLKDIFQVIDYSNYFFELSKFTLAQNKNWINEVGSWLSPHHWLWHDIHNYIIPKGLEKQKKALIFGKDKPSLQKEKNNYYFSFPDCIINSYGFYKGTNNLDIINFYWDPSFPYILLKQLHILKKFQTLYNGINLVEHKTYNTNHNTIEVGRLIYDLKNPLRYVSPKSPSTIFSLRDNYLLNKKNSNVYDMFKNGVRNLSARLKNTTIQHRYSKRYYIT